MNWYKNSAKKNRLHVDSLEKQSHQSMFAIGSCNLPSLWQHELQYKEVAYLLKNL